MIQGVFIAILLSFVFGFFVGILTYRKVTIIRRRQKIKKTVEKYQAKLDPLLFWKKKEPVKKN